VPDARSAGRPRRCACRGGYECDGSGADAAFLCLCIPRARACLACLLLPSALSDCLQAEEFASTSSGRSCTSSWP
jgi:hypothetical protein